MAISLPSLPMMLEENLGLELKIAGSLDGETPVGFFLRN